ncbi:hybrid sensor histidine kinase/response regulator [Leptothrix discophora]|uniref:histidine kinase n=1 Tax=Leptothrix discophora TaxID=89 RepID=A0ABT9G308_LEPDI|nr:ATP-binding protein [Leptothrix discophora]MDP4300810.1 ATP-binding protein [Leptothrix discophora]
MSALPPVDVPASAASAWAEEAPPQRVIKVRRDYNSWVAHETIEDYALRFTPRAARRWGIGRVANTAFGGASSFLVLEAVGATLLVQHGFVNAALAILATALVIALAGIPISVYAARHGLDMDLLTRGAGFGYIGSTLTSLIYASFTFIFFALEAAVMAYALELAFDIPPAWGYLVCALVVIPLVTHGVTLISRLQVWSQPLWLAMLLLPYAYVFARNPGLLDELRAYGGERDLHGFDGLAFGAAMTVGIALITQMGEQADYLRFMPERTPRNRLRWWAGTLVGGIGWIVPGVLKMLGGALLASLAIGHSVPTERAVDPNQMYLAAYEYVFPNYGWAVAATALFVVVSQLKINVTNAYAGSLAWSNFFSRVAHSHPGRVVWMLFNILIALVLMELDVFQALGGVLGLYSNLAISWLMAVVADLVINKPLGLSPPGIEFRRAYLWDINPVGVGAMVLASLLSVAAYLGLFGPWTQAWSAAIALVTACIASPLIAWATGGRYYLARTQPAGCDGAPGGACAACPSSGTYRRLGRPTEGAPLSLARCSICERDYESDDMAACPAYGGPICSLCCTLDARCNDLCKPQARLSVQWSAALRRLLPRRVWPYLDKGLGHFVLLMLVVVPLLGLMFGVLYHQELRTLEAQGLSLSPDLWSGLTEGLRAGYVKAYAALLLAAGVVAWWLVLAHQSRVVAQEESNRQTEALHQQTVALQREIASHRQTDLALQDAKAVADAARAQAEAANGAKTRYITAISHELRTPLNSILGYAQLLEEDEAMPAHRRQAVGVIRRGGDHLLSLIEGTLDLARIEGGKLALQTRPMRFADTLAEIARLFELQAASKGIAFRSELDAHLPAVVRADERRLRQILINLVGNAVKFTQQGQVVLRVQHAREIARFEIVDSGPGMDAAELERVFEPFERGSAAGAASGSGTGLGLTISRMLTALMGGEMTVDSTPGVGTTFRLKLFLPALADDAALPREQVPVRIGQRGRPRRILVVDNEEADRGLLLSMLAPLGFDLRQAASGEEALALLATLAPSQRPEAVFMDLAMPGIDGWETLRRLQRDWPADAPPPVRAIVSANAFDQALDNDVGITPADFFVKPVRLHELLDWLGRQLSIDWIDAPRIGVPTGSGHEPAGRVDATSLPPDADLSALREALSLGYLRGVMRALDGLQQRHARSAASIERWRGLARGFQLDALLRELPPAPLTQEDDRRA